MSKQKHVPVLLKEVISCLDPRPGKRYIDATLGGGGYTAELLKGGAEVLALDWDEEAIRVLMSSSEFTPAIKAGRLRLVHENFTALRQVAEDNKFTEVDGITLDLGFSSTQLDDPERGFSFQARGPLDMRLDQGQKLTAAEVVNTYPESELVRIFTEYGEESGFARRIARELLSARRQTKLETTLDLVAMIKSALPQSLQYKAYDFIRRIFQAIRIEVNHELENLRVALEQAEQLLGSDGVVAVVSFHSLEDRIVKQFFKKKSSGVPHDPEVPLEGYLEQPTLELVTKKPITPSEEELLTNPRAGSAKLRVARKLN